MSTVGKKTSITTDINTEREGETFLPKDSNGKELNLIDYEDRYNVLIMELKKIDKNFEVEKYKFSVNLYTEDANDGYMVATNTTTTIAIAITVIDFLFI